MKTHTQSFVNGTSKAMKVCLEMYGDQYILGPGQTFEITYGEDLNRPGMGLYTCVWEDCLQVYAQEFETAVVRIDGVLAEPRNTE